MGGKRILQAINKLMNRWKVEHDAEEANKDYQQRFNQLMSTAQRNATWTSTTTSTLNQLNATTNISGLYGMGGQLGSGLAGMTFGPGSISNYPSRYTWELTDEQLEKLMKFMERAMQHSWTCSKCERQYAPLTPDCEFCNLIERLEGVEKQEQVA